MFQQYALGQLQVEAARVQTGLFENGLDGAGEVRMAELPRRQINRHLQIREPATVPGRALLAGRAQHPLPEGDDEAGLLRQPDELVRLDEPMLGVLPAQQRLNAQDIAAAIHDRADRPAKTRAA